MSRSLGGASLLTVFADLCLIVFALLALTTAKSSERLSMASARFIAGYYEAQLVSAELQGGYTQPGVSLSGGVYVYSSPDVEVKIDSSSFEVLSWEVKGEQP